MPNIVDLYVCICSYSMYAVVEFRDGLQVVPSSWLTKNNSFCLWPADVNNQLKLNAMIASADDPQRCWTDYQVLRVIGTAGKSFFLTFLNCFIDINK